MQLYKMNQTSRGRMFIIIGVVLIGALFVWYNRYQNPETLTPDAIAAIQWLSYMFYVLLGACLSLIGWGVYLFHKGMIHKDGLLGIIASTTWNTKSQRIFVVSFVTYGVFFSLVSGTLVYQSMVDFEIHYGASIPSAFVAPCCGDIGYMPTIIVYLTNHVGLQIIPLNTVLQITISYLVALNVSLSAVAYSASKKTRGAGTVGAITGLFVACPTCAGTAASIFVGTASGIALSLALTQLQTVLIAVSIPVLLATPFLLAKQLRACQVR